MEWNMHGFGFIPSSVDYIQTVAVGYVENARPANQSAIVTVRNGRPAGQNDPQSV